MNMRSTAIRDDGVSVTNDVRIALTRLGAPLLYAHDANTFLKRFRGLHAYPPLGLSDALVIRPCRSIQTYGMKYAIDVAFLDAAGHILKLATVKPAGSAWCFRSHIAVEMHAGAAQRLDLAVGQLLLPENRSWT